MEFPRSKELFSEAARYIPGGVNSPVRAFKSVGGTPLFIKRGAGARIEDVDGNELIDYVGSWGPLILGHAHPKIIEAVENTLSQGTSFGAPTTLEIEMAEQIVEAVPSIEKVRMVSSGTEAVMSAARLARGYTKRSKIVKFEGCYHGHSDTFLSKAGSGLVTLGIPGSPGVTEGAAADTINLPYNNLEKVTEILTAQGDEIAAVILEPIAGNMGVIPPKPGFLEGLRQLTRDSGAVLIFDEVITGFRVGYGGAQELYNIEPDLTCLGKIIGGGFPVGAFGGKKEIMDEVAPTGGVYQAGTLSGNPVAMAAGSATLKFLSQTHIYKVLEQRAARLADGIKQAAETSAVEAFFTRVGSMSCMFFTDQEVNDFESAQTSDTEKYGRYFWGMIEQGCYFAPSQFEAAFVSMAHTDQEIDRTIEAAAKVFEKLK